VSDGRYPTDRTDPEWSILAPHFPPAATGRPRTRPVREILDAIFYVLRAGCAWRLLPREFPPWPTVYYYFRTWRTDGTWDLASQELRRAERVRQGRDPEPSAAIVDSQSVKTTEKGDRAATTSARRPTDASATSRSTHSDCC
jgi:putative transposase